jgi:hypothetical protein
MANRTLLPAAGLSPHSVPWVVAVMRDYEATNQYLRSCVECRDFEIHRFQCQRQELDARHARSVALHDTQQRTIDAQKGLIESLRSELARYQTQLAAAPPRELQINTMFSQESMLSSSSSSSPAFALPSASIGSFPTQILLGTAESTDGDAPSVGDGDMVKKEHHRCLSD